MTESFDEALWEAQTEFAELLITTDFPIRLPEEKEE